MEKKEYIERGKLIDDIKRVYCAGCDNWNEVKCRACAIDDAILQIDSAPAADVVEVVHGEWEIVSESYRLFDDYDEAYSVKCPFCDRTYSVPFEFEEEKMIAYAREHYPYCHCGAKMDGERKEE